MGGTTKNLHYTVNYFCIFFLYKASKLESKVVLNFRKKVKCTCFYKSFYNVNLDNWCSACFLFLEHDINGRAYGSRLNAMSMIKNKQSRNVIARVFFSQLKFSTY